MISGKTEKKRARLIARAQKNQEVARKKTANAQTAKRNGINQPLTKVQKAAFAAKTALDEEEKAVTKACFDEVQEVLKKHGCRLHAQPVTVPRNDGLFVLGANVVISKAPPAPEISPTE